jgi:hypothetical protein
MKRVIILISVFLPVLYLSLYVLIDRIGMPVEVRVFIAEYGSVVVIFQFIFCVMGFFTNRKASTRIFLIMLFLLFTVFLFNTIERFNPV